jgi:hypothetical protein
MKRAPGRGSAVTAGHESLYGTTGTGTTGTTGTGTTGTTGIGTACTVGTAAR